MLHVLIGIHVRLCHSNTDHVVAVCNVQLGLETLKDCRFKRMSM